MQSRTGNNTRYGSNAMTQISENHARRKHDSTSSESTDARSRRHISFFFFFSIVNNTWEICLKYPRRYAYTCLRFHPVCVELIIYSNHVHFTTRASHSTNIFTNTLHTQTHDTYIVYAHAYYLKQNLESTIFSQPKHARVYKLSNFHLRVRKNLDSTKIFQIRIHVYLYMYMYAMKKSVRNLYKCTNTRLYFNFSKTQLHTGVFLPTLDKKRTSKNIETQPGIYIYTYVYVYTLDYFLQVSKSSHTFLTTQARTHTFPFRWLKPNWPFSRPSPRREFPSPVLERRGRSTLNWLDMASAYTWPGEVPGRKYKFYTDIR